MRLHNWAFDDPSVFEQVYGDLMQETGAVIMGRRSYDNSIEAWGGKGPLGDVPCFVVTHRPLEPADPLFTVTDGIESAWKQASRAAGGKDVRLGGGVSTIQQFLRAGLIDELHLAIAPILLGSGEHFFGNLNLAKLGYECVEHVPAPKATHVVLRKKRVA